MADARTIQKAFVFYQRALSRARRDAPTREAAHIMALRQVVGEECEASDEDLVKTWDEAEVVKGNKIFDGIQAIVLTFNDGVAPVVATAASVPAHLRRSGGSVNAEDLNVGDHILHLKLERIVTAVHQDRHMLNIVLDQGQRPPNVMVQVGDSMTMAPPPPPPPDVPRDRPIVGEMPAGEYEWCACGLSKIQPFCDGSHVEGDTELTPLHFSVPEPKKIALCTCKKTKNPPYCDGSHKNDEPTDEDEVADLDEAVGDIATEVEDALDAHEDDGTLDELDATLHDEDVHSGE